MSFGFIFQIRSHTGVWKDASYILENFAEVKALYDEALTIYDKKDLRIIKCWSNGDEELVNG